jgi:hypothetical protein
MTPNRVVAVLTPLVFAPLAGAVSAWLARHAPGITVQKDDVQAVFIGGALIALAPALQWLHGWQKYEAREADKEQAVEVATIQTAAVEEAAPAADDSGGFDGLDDFDDFDDADEFGDVDEPDDELFADEQLAGTRD